MMKKSGKKYSFKARLLGAVLALSLAAGLVPAALAEAAPTNAPAVTEAPAEAAPAEATVAPAEAEAAAAPAEAGRKAFLPGDKAGHPVTSMEEAAKVVASLHK